MSKFKISDQVKVNNEYSGFYNNVGFVTEVLEDSGLPYTLVFDAADDFSYFAEDELELIS
ncbi:hypothetical protein [Robertmurraya sp.]|uniref:hypothetical protein n=1 Tax=Robertmurraya sp. TaxID=2837525 RepID=UPI003704651D